MNPLKDRCNLCRLPALNMADHVPGCIREMRPKFCDFGSRFFHTVLSKMSHPGFIGCYDLVRTISLTHCDQQHIVWIPASAMRGGANPAPRFGDSRWYIDACHAYLIPIAV